jgi:predicted peptidase
MGGFGAWIAISRYPRLFAAAIPVCGGGDPLAVSGTTTKVWAFHGSADTVVPPRRSREMIEALKKAGASPRYTEFAGVGHNAWEHAYGEPGLADWLFSQQLESEPPAGEEDKPPDVGQTAADPGQRSDRPAPGITQ